MDTPQDAYALAHGVFMPGDEPVRPESGAMRFPDDWVGVFIRGDDALAYADDLQKIMDDRVSYAVYLSPLIQLLRSCKVK